MLSYRKIEAGGYATNNLIIDGTYMVRSPTQGRDKNIIGLNIFICFALDLLSQHNGTDSTQIIAVALMNEFFAFCGKENILKIRFYKIATHRIHLLLVPIVAQIGGGKED